MTHVGVGQSDSVLNMSVNLIVEVILSKIITELCVLEVNMHVFILIQLELTEPHVYFRLC